ncbi:MAG TPA: alkylhydroperoxidase-related (seleno)protein [Ilumatobacter sp.]
MIVRDDLADAHREAWAHLARPGSWWTAAQRIELANTALGAIRDVEPLPPWASVSAVEGRLPGDHVAPAAAHDVVYRIARHAATMTEDVYRRVSEQLGALPYVELVSVVTTVAAVAHFCRNVGVDVPPFPEPEAGEPSGDVPDEVVQPGYNWVPVRAPADQLAAVVQAYTAVPGEFLNLWRMSDAQYMPSHEMIDPGWTRRDGGLSRPQTELVAARVAQLRDCFY